ncbi:hypothetical protein Tco_0259860 [Tanacetum coccineum]
MNHPTERLRVRRHDTSLSWTREMYYELCSAPQEARACMQCQALANKVAISASNWATNKASLRRDTLSSEPGWKRIL